jgi:hypothetical protein
MLAVVMHELSQFVLRETHGHIDTVLQEDIGRMQYPAVDVFASHGVSLRYGR